MADPITFKGHQVEWDPPSIQDLANALIKAMRLPVCPGSIEIHFSADGIAQKVDVHAVGWKRQGKADGR